jgi:hypothetical protein
MAIINDVIRSSAIYTNKFGREDNKRKRKLINNPKAVY